MRASARGWEPTGAYAMPAAEEAASTTWRWVRYPEFWLALVVGAVLRLWGLSSTQFLDDQASMMTLAREAVLRHALPVASIPSSIHTLNPPLSIFLLLPFTLLGTDPLPAVIALALWNVLGVALCYIFARRYFGRRVAAVGTLLFAVCPTTVGYSRFLWQQNYLPPLLILWAMAIYAGCIRGRRGMLIPAVSLLVLGALLHVTVLLLAPALLAGVLLAPHLPRWREYALSAAIGALLLAPTFLWEAVSGWSDLRILTAYSSGRAKIDLEVFFRLYEALGAPSLPQSGPAPHPAPHTLGEAIALLATPVAHPALGPASPYAAAAPLYIATGLAALLLFGAGWLTLTWYTFAPALRLWRERPVERRKRVRLAAWGRTVWHGLRADAGWRIYLLLWLIVTAPPALLMRHSSEIFTHYLIVLYPFAFLTMALGALALARSAARIGGRRPARAAQIIVFALVVALIAGQTAQAMLTTISIASGQFDAAAAGYGYPLSAMEQADARLSQLQRQTGAHAIFVAEPTHAVIPLDYLLIREHPDRIGVADSCLVLPPPDAMPGLVVASSNSLAARTLAGLPNATHLTDIPMAGNPPLTVYRMASALPPSLPGETALGPVRFTDAASQGLELEAAARDAGNLVRLRWTVSATTPAGAVPLSFRVRTRSVSSTGQVSGVRDFRDCEPTRWEAGETVFTLLLAPTSWRGVSPMAPDTMLIQTQESTAALAMPSFGPLRLLSAQIQRTPWILLAPEPVSNPPREGVQPEYGGIVLSKDILSP